MTLILRAIALSAIVFSTSAAFAKGYMKLVFQNREGFNKIEIYEENGSYEGQMVGTGGWAPISLSSTPTHFYYSVGNESNWFMRDTGGLKLTYRGRMSGGRLSQFESYTRKDGGIGLTGKMQDKVDYSIYCSKDKKGKWNLLMAWLGFEIDLKSEPKEGPGAASGKLRVNSTETLGELIFDSEGSLENIIFKDADHAAAWLVDSFVFVPRDTQP